MKFILTLLAFILMAVVTASAATVKTERVKFATGSIGAEVKGKITGYDTVHYLLGASSGQTMRVKLSTKSTSISFNVFAPGMTPGNDEAMFIGDTGGNVFEGVLPSTGDYLIQVYLYRNAARRNEHGSFALGIEVAASSGESETGGGDAKVAGTEFNATGEIPCARFAGQPMGQCKFGVVRRGGGGADVTISWPDGGNRVIFFSQGEPSGYDESQADGGARLAFTKTIDLFQITIGNQRFEIPEAVVFGG